MPRSRYGYCDRCKWRVFLDEAHPERFDRRKFKTPAADYGASHLFCDDCLTLEELEQSVELGEIPSIASLSE
jgi:hypothetical protein